MAANHVNQKL